MQHSKQKVPGARGKDFFLWLLFGLIILGIILGNLYFNALNTSLRMTVIVLLVILATGIARMTRKGKLAWGFIKESRLELKKVVWPTRQETLRTSFLIFVIVVLMSLILWGVDSLFALLVSSILI